LIRGLASLGDLVVAWEIPSDHPDAAGGLEHLPLTGIPAASATWSLRSGPSGPRPSRFDAFYGETLLSFAPDHAHVWSPTAELHVEPDEVYGTVSGPCILPTAVALHTLAAFHGVLHVHAALVTLDGRTYLLPGASGAGKTSAALAVGRHGGELLADDAVYVDAELRAWGVRRPPHVTSRTLAAHPGLVDLGPVADGVLDKRRVASPTPGPAPARTIDAVLAPELDPNGATHLAPLDPANAFARLLASSMVTMVEGSPLRDSLLDRLAELAALPVSRLVAGPDALEDPSRLVGSLRRAPEA
jgi:hypothetical protein